MILLDLVVYTVRLVLPFFLYDDHVPQHDSTLSGHLYYEEIINTHNRNRFLSINRMDKRTFILLVDLLVTSGKLKDSLCICAGQKLMIFIHSLLGNSNRETAERWQHSGSTISDIIHEVVESLYHCIGILFISE